jgi:hypothetical protein
MGRFALSVMAVIAWIAAAKSGYSLSDGLTDNLWLVGLFPATYMLGLALLGD